MRGYGKLGGSRGKKGVGLGYICKMRKDNFKINKLFNKKKGKHNKNIWINIKIKYKISFVIKIKWIKGALW